MTYLPCSGCGARLRDDGRYYPIAPLAEFLRCTESQACRAARLSGSSERRARCHGIRRRKVEAIAHELHEHPSAIWLDIVDHDIEDLSRRCPDCDELFVPTWRTQRFCSRNHEHNFNARRRYAESAKARARRAERRRAYYEANREQILADRRSRAGRTVNAINKRRRYHNDPTARERILANNRAWKQRQKEQADEAA